MVNYANDVRVVFRHLPLHIHSWVRAAAEAMACVALQDNRAFWIGHDFLFATQKEITAENLRDMIEHELWKATGFDMARYRSCVANRDSAKVVDEDIDLAHTDAGCAFHTDRVRGYPASKWDIVS